MSTFQKNDIEIWYETFGNPKDPALLLIMGVGAQGLMYPTEFCEKLVNKGYFVIRYDNRDVGLSSTIDYSKNPYTLKDMADDAIALLDHLTIKKAHVLGSSMGGSIVQILGANYPNRIQSLIAMATTPDLSPVLNPLTHSSPLPPPKPEYMAWMGKMMTALQEGSSKNDLFELSVEGWRIMNGKAAPFDEPLYRSLIMESMKRTRDPKHIAGHILAMRHSIDLLKNAPSQVNVPTLIINGTEDPIFSIEHGQALAKSILGAKLYLVKGMGHNINPIFYDEVITAIANHAV